MTRARGVALLAAVVLVLAVLVVRARLAPSPPGSRAGERQPGAAGADQAADQRDRDAGAGASVDRDGRTPPDAHDALGARDPVDAWREQVARAVDRIARERLGRGLTPADQARLVDALASVGPAARALDRESLDPDDPASIARVREQTAALVSADRTCRDVLGIGVAELLRMLDPSAVEDRGRSDD